ATSVTDPEMEPVGVCATSRPPAVIAIRTRIAACETLIFIELTSSTRNIRYCTLNIDTAHCANPLRCGPEGYFMRRSAIVIVAAMAAIGTQSAMLAADN